MEAVALAAGYENVEVIASPFSDILEASILYSSAAESVVKMEDAVVNPKGDAKKILQILHHCHK
jgi:hypothetical protein